MNKYKTHSWYWKRKSPRMLRIKDNFFILRNAIYEKSVTYPVPNLLLKIRIYAWLSALTISIQPFLGGPGHCNKWRKRGEMHMDGMEEVKPSQQRHIENFLLKQKQK